MFTIIGKRRWRLEDDIRFEGVTVKAGYETDFASVPRKVLVLGLCLSMLVVGSLSMILEPWVWVWAAAIWTFIVICNVLTFPFREQIAVAAVFHDYGYGRYPKSFWRKTCVDLHFFRALRSPLISPGSLGLWWSFWIFMAVLLFGWGYYVKSAS
jgi:hypothetical protein